MNSHGASPRDSGSNDRSPQRDALPEHGDRESRSDGMDSTALTVGDHDGGLHPDHSDLMADTSITTADEFEQGLIQRGYKKDNRGQWHHPRQQAVRLAPRDDGDSSEDEGDSTALTVGDHDGGLHPDHSDLMADTSITTADEFEQGLIQRGYKKDNRGQWHHPRQQAVRLAPRDDGDGSEDEGDSTALTVDDHDGGLHPDHGDLMADASITTADEFEQGLIQRGYKKDDRGRWLHPRQGWRMAMGVN